MYYLYITGWAIFIELGRLLWHIVRSVLRGFFRNHCHYVGIRFVFLLILLYIYFFLFLELIVTFTYTLKLKRSIIFLQTGIENFLNDVEFMLDRKTGSYWRICWFLVTPLILLFIFFYTFATLQLLTYGEKEYPISAHAAGIVVSCLGIFQIPFWMIVKLLKNRSLPLSKVCNLYFYSFL